MTRPDGHPIPRIQEMLDNLSGNSWFSALDQGKAYHQGFMSSNSQPFDCLHYPLGYVWVGPDTILSFLCAWSIPTFYGELLRRLERHCLCTLPGWHYHIQCHLWGSHWKHMQGSLTTKRICSQTETSEMLIVSERGYIPWAHCVRRGLQARSIQC